MQTCATARSSVPACARNQDNEHVSKHRAVRCRSFDTGFASAHGERRRFADGRDLWRLTGRKLLRLRGRGGCLCPNQMRTPRWIENECIQHSVLVQRKWDKRRCSLRESEQNKHCEWIYRFRANPGPGVRAASCRPSGLGPGSALRSRPRVALSSAQALSV